MSITALRPAGAQDAGHFHAAAPRRPGPAELPDRRLRLVAPASSPRGWGAVLGARIAAPDWVTAEWSQEVSSPVLLDTEGLLVSDDWSWIARSLATASGSPIYPAALREEIDALEQVIDAELIGALEEVVFSTEQAVRDAVARLLFARLGLLDLRLADHRYLLGEELATADLTLFGVLLGWDLRYRAHLGWGRGLPGRVPEPVDVGPPTGRRGALGRGPGRRRPGGRPRRLFRRALGPGAAGRGDRRHPRRVARTGGVGACAHSPNS